MSTTAICPHCGNVQEVTPQTAGRALACTSCGAIFRSDNPYATPVSLKEMPAPGATGARGAPGTVNFDQALSRGFNLYTGNFGALVLVSLVFCSVQFGLAIAQQIPILGVLVALVAPFTLTPVVNAGFALATLRLYDGAPAKVDHLFAEFRMLGELAMLVLVQVGIWMAAVIPSLVIAGVAIVPWVIRMDKNPNATPEIWQMAVGGVGVLLFLVTATVLTMGFFWSYVALVDRRAGFWDAVRTSWTITRQSPGATFGLLLIGGLAGSLGLIVCLVGIIFTLPVYYALTVAGYRTAAPAVEPATEPAAPPTAALLG